MPDQARQVLEAIGADRGPVAGRLYYTGSVKWLGTRFDRHDLAELRVASARVPGAEPGRTGLVAVSLSGWDLPAADRAALTVAWGPDDVVAAWRSG